MNPPTTKPTFSRYDGLTHLLDTLLLVDILSSHESLSYCRSRSVELTRGKGPWINHVASSQGRLRANSRVGAAEPTRRIERREVVMKVESHHAKIKEHRSAKSYHLSSSTLKTLGYRTSREDLLVEYRCRSV